jgi:hypothetical protein
MMTVMTIEAGKPEKVTCEWFTKDSERQERALDVRSLQRESVLSELAEIGF